jgi:hypothetical protein
MVERMPIRKYAYFRDDQVVFLVTHSQNNITSDDLNLLKEKVDDSLKELLGTLVSITWPETQIFSFPRPTGLEREQEAAIINELLERNPNLDVSDYRSGLFDDQDQSKLGFSIIVGNITFDDPEQQETLDPSTLIGLIRTLRDTMKNNEELFDGQLIIHNVSPNWLMGNASQGGSTGGPGGLPKPFKGTDKSGGKKAGFNVEEKLGSLYGTGENVDVAILDTAPCPHDLVIAHKEWQKDHPIIRTLLGPKGKLRLYPASYDQLLRMYNTSFNSHDYQMSDHALFEAGIIHSIAPEATIHLIEVLNPLGVGDLLTLAEGFHTIFHKIYKEAPPGRKLVVNCSLMLELPIEDGHCYADDKKKDAVDKEPPDNVDDVNFEYEVLQLATEDQDTVLEINELCKKFFGVGRQVVAAAGNDWENGKARRRRQKLPILGPPLARYPAGFASVVGVGALRKNSFNPQTGKHETSKYSNLGDRPAGDGIMTLGGEEGETHGILGLYLSEKFPKRSHINSDNDKNKITMYTRTSNQDEAKNEDNRWAWWSGTSFATPILTGTIAAVLSSKLPGGTYQFDNTQAVIRALYTNKIIEDEMTDAQEDVMDVKQDRPLPT